MNIGSFNPDRPEIQRKYNISHAEVDSADSRTILEMYNSWFLSSLVFFSITHIQHTFYKVNLKKTMSSNQQIFLQ